MDFFENIGRKVAEAGREVSQQTKNMADVARLNSDISAEEKRILQTYSEIGEAYYENHRNDSMSEFAEKLEKINNSFRKIEQLREQIKTIKGVTRCSSCGADISRDSVFCPACGAKIIKIAKETEKADTRICPQCGAKVGTDNRFCSNCGESLL